MRAGGVANRGPVLAPAAGPPRALPSRVPEGVHLVEMAIEDLTGLGHVCRAWQHARVHLVGDECEDDA